MRMRRAHAFHDTYDTQRVFRALLAAFANPGRVQTIAEPAAGLNTPCRAYLALACTLLDSTTSYCVLGDEDLSTLIHQFTFAKPAPLEDSGFVFVGEQCRAEEMAALLALVPRGTPEEPHLGATVFLRLETMEGALDLAGPGIETIATAPLPGYAESWLAAREAAALEYPCGVDFVFLTDAGELVAVPRLVKPV